MKKDSIPTLLSIFLCSLALYFFLFHHQVRENQPSKTADVSKSSTSQPLKKIEKNSSEKLPQNNKPLKDSQVTAAPSKTLKPSPKKLKPTWESSPFISWGVKPSKNKSDIDLASAQDIFEKKRDVVVAVIDTGIDPYHPFIAQNIYVPQEIKKKFPEAYGVDFTQNEISGTPYDDHGHGTHLAGIIKGIFDGVKILPLKYYAPENSMEQNFASHLRALKYAIDQNVDIINYSSGGPGQSISEVSLLKKALEKGILVVTAAGNEGENIDDPGQGYYPASYEMTHLIKVSAHDQKLKKLQGANWGKEHVDLFAPGHRIRSSFPGGRATLMTGTSQATAFVSGVAAMVKAQFNFNQAQIKKVILNSTVKNENFKNFCSTEGKLSAYRAILLGKAMSEVLQQRNIAGQ